MAAPTINSTTSVLGYKQWQTWEFQPITVLGDDTFWNISGLPTGMDFNPVSGLISGAAELPGVYNCGLIAGNDDGASDILKITIGIEAGGYGPPKDEVDLWIDLQTGIVTFSNVISAAVTPASEKDKPLVSLKSNDDVFFRIRFSKGGVIADLDLDELAFGIKSLDDEPVIVDSGTFAKAGSGENTSYLLRATMTDAALDAALSDDEDPKGTKINALAEFTWTAPATLGASTAVRSSRTFIAEVVREIIPN